MAKASETMTMGMRACWFGMGEGVPDLDFLGRWFGADVRPEMVWGQPWGPGAVRVKEMAG